MPWLKSTPTHLHKRPRDMQQEMDWILRNDGFPPVRVGKKHFEASTACQVAFFGRSSLYPCTTMLDTKDNLFFSSQEWHLEWQETWDWSFQQIASKIWQCESSRCQAFCPLLPGFKLSLNIFKRSGVHLQTTYPQHWSPFLQVTSWIPRQKRKCAPLFQRPVSMQYENKESTSVGHF